MAIDKITIPLDADAARAYTSASEEEQKKLRLLLGLWLRDLVLSPTPLNQVIDEVSDKAKKRGLTADTLDSLLNAN